MKGLSKGLKKKQKDDVENTNLSKNVIKGAGPSSNKPIVADSKPLDIINQWFPVLSETIPHKGLERP